MEDVYYKSEEVRPTPVWRDFSADHPLVIYNQEAPSNSASIHKSYTSEFNMQNELLISWQDTI